jgi:hypothetical protein
VSDQVSHPCKKNRQDYSSVIIIIIDVATPGDRNVIDLTTGIQCMWNVKTNVIPVIIRATGTISNSFRKYLSNVSGIHEVKELQKTAILGTAHTLWKVLM